MNKKLKLIPLIFILTLITVPFAYAATVSILAQNTTSTTTYDNVITGGFGVGVKVTGDGDYLHKVSFKWENRTAGTTYGNFRAYVYPASALNHNPNSTYIEESDIVSANVAAAEWVNFTFANTTQLENLAEYYILVRVQGTGLSTGVDFQCEAVAGTGCVVTGWSDSTLSAYTSKTFNYIVYVVDYGEDPTPSPSPTPTAAPDSSATDALIDTFVDILVPLIIFLLPALILGWLTHWQKWPILIGLAIGSGLVYMFLGAEYLWLVILVVIGIGASAYQSSRGG